MNWPSSFQNQNLEGSDLAVNLKLNSYEMLTPQEAMTREWSLIESKTILRLYKPTLLCL